MDNNTLALRIESSGAGSLVPTLQAAIARILRRQNSTCEGFLCMASGRGRDLVLTTDDESVDTFKVDTDFLLYGLRAEFHSTDPNDLASTVKVELTLPSGQRLLGDQRQGLNLAHLVDVEDLYHLAPPILVVPNTEITIRARSGSLSGTCGMSLAFVGVALSGLSS